MRGISRSSQAVTDLERLKSLAKGWVPLPKPKKQPPQGRLLLKNLKGPKVPDEKHYFLIKDFTAAS
jgi:hypothetical protein